MKPKRKVGHRHRYSEVRIDDYGGTDYVCKCGAKK